MLTEVSIIILFAGRVLGLMNVNAIPHDLVFAQFPTVSSADIDIYSST